eukprot:scaffold21361_cov27-Tisochrysis_lutea.AAC.4
MRGRCQVARSCRLTHGWHQPGTCPPPPGRVGVPPSTSRSEKPPTLAAAPSHCATQPPLAATPSGGWTTVPRATSLVRAVRFAEQMPPSAAPRTVRARPASPR